MYTARKCILNFLGIGGLFLLPYAILDVAAKLPPVFISSWSILSYHSMILSLLRFSLFNSKVLLPPNITLVSCTKSWGIRTKGRREATLYCGEAFLK